MEKLTYTRDDLVKEVAAIFNEDKARDEKVSQKKIKELLGVVSEVIADYLSEATPDCDIEVKTMPGITFKGMYVGSKQGRNPMTGEPIQIAPRIKLRASFTKGYKDGVNGVEE